METNTREILTDAVRYWEIRRLVYNAVLAVVVTAAYVSLPEGKREAVSFGSVAGLVILAVIANLLYCAAYVPDLALQFTAFRDRWRKLRILLFVFGTLFASLLAFLCLPPLTFD